MTDVGRPTLYRSDYCELARNYCLLGATNAELAQLFAVAPRTIDNWIAAQPAFATAVKEARALADAQVARCLYDRAIGYQQKVERTVLHQGKEHRLTDTINHPPDTRACIFWLRNRQPRFWSRRAEPAQDDADDIIAGLEAGGEQARREAMRPPEI